MDLSSKQTFWRFHPVTGQDANDVDTMGWTSDQKSELAQMVQNGALFYWEKSDELPEHTIQGYVRIEKSNILFVLRMTGTAFEFIDKPSCAA